MSDEYAECGPPVDSSSFFPAGLRILFYGPQSLPPHTLLRKLPDTVVSRFPNSPLVLPDGIVSVSPALAAAAQNVPLLAFMDPAGGALAFMRGAVQYSWSKVDQNDNRPFTYFQEEGQRLLEDSVSSIDLAVTRIGLVITSVAYHPTPGRFLEHRFSQQQWWCNPDIPNRQFDTQFHKVILFREQVSTNILPRFRAASESNTQKPVILAELDTNTVPPHPEVTAQPFDRQTRSEFITFSFQQFSSALSHYFNNADSR